MAGLSTRQVSTSFTTSLPLSLGRSCDGVSKECLPLCPIAFIFVSFFLAHFHCRVESDQYDAS